MDVERLTSNVRRPIAGRAKPIGEDGSISDRSDLVGVAWNRERVSLESDVFRPALHEGTLWQKPPQAVKFSTGPGLTDVVVMPVQLEPKEREADCLAGTRGEEASDLASHIQAAKTYFGDDDVVVIGDTDCIRDDPGPTRGVSNRTDPLA